MSDPKIAEYLNHHEVAASGAYGWGFTNTYYEEMPYEDDNPELTALLETIGKLPTE